MTDLLSEFPVVLTFPVHWGEMDAFQHVNNVAYFRYFESVRIAYFNATGGFGATGGGPGKGIGPILAETSCRYRMPLTHPDTLRAGARTTSYYEHGFLHEYALVSERTGQVAATGTARIVTYDYDRGVKVAVPEQLLKMLFHLEKREVPANLAPSR